MQSTLNNTTQRGCGAPSAFPQPLAQPTAFRIVFTGQPTVSRPTAVIRPSAPSPTPSQIMPANTTAMTTAVTTPNIRGMTTRARRTRPHPEGAPDPAAAKKALREAGLHLRRLIFTQGGKVDMYLSAKGAATFGFSQPTADGTFRIPAEVAEACRLTFEQAMAGMILAGSAQVVGLGRPAANDYLCIRARWKEAAPAPCAPTIRTVPVAWDTPAFHAAFPARG